jgi:hypothetical protein
MTEEEDGKMQVIKRAWWTITGGKTEGQQEKEYRKHLGVRTGPWLAASKEKAISDYSQEELDSTNYLVVSRDSG